MSRPTWEGEPGDVVSVEPGTHSIKIGTEREAVYCLCGWESMVHADGYEDEAWGEAHAHLWPDAYAKWRILVAAGITYRSFDAWMDL